LLRDFLKQTATYGGVNLVSSFIAFIAFLLYARYLSVGDYGVVGLIASSMAVFTGIAQFGLPNSMQRFFYEQEYAQSDVFHATLGLTLGLNLLMSISAILVISLLALFWNILSYWQLVILALVAAPFTAVTNLMVELQRLDFKLFPYAVTKLIMVTGSTSFPLFFLVFLNGGLKGFYWGSTIGAACVCFLVLSRFWHKIKGFTFHKKLAAQLLVFGYPFVYASISLVAFNSLDKWMLGYMKTIEDVGFYTAGETIIKIIVFFNTAIAMSWAPQVLKLYSVDADYKEKIVKLFYLTFSIFIFVAGVFCIFLNEIIKIAMPSTFWEIHVASMILSIGVVGLFLHQMAALGLSLEKKSKIIARGWIITTCLNVLLNVIFIPMFSYNGAALSTTICYLFLAVYYFWRSQDVHAFSIDFYRVVTLFLGFTIIVSSVYIADRHLLSSLYLISLSFKVMAAILLLFIIYKVNLISFDKIIRESF
jgi:O-antigen/teichoic acid export membrane protein